ncbi:MAG TPA: META domain-containing protein [Longimicrobium sp.]|nr:META domain-containing protein [Longimicrobium sp.]
MRRMNIKAGRSVRWLGLALTLGACTMPGSPDRVPATAPSAGEQAVALENTTWTLVDVGGQAARPIGSLAGPTLRLDAAEKRASGNAGCNQYGGSYTLSGGSLQLGPLASTRRACVDEALTRQETAFLRALDETRSWRITDGALILSSASGQVARLAATR